MLAPSGELTSVTFGPEGSFGSAGAVTTAAICSAANFQLTRDLLARSGAKRRIGRTRSAQGMWIGKGSFSMEMDPDNAGFPLKTVMGAESIAASAANPSAPSLAGVTTTAAIPTLGLQSVILAGTTTGIVRGVQLAIDTAGNLETVTVLVWDAALKQITATFTKTHLTGIAVAAGTVTNAQEHTFTLASPRGSFSAQVNEVISARTCVGMKMSSLSLAMSPKSILEAKCAVAYQTESFLGSVTNPAYSNLYPFIFETAGNYGQVNGANADASIQSWGVDVNPTLTTDYPQFGNGPFVSGFPEGETKVSGNIMLAFETDTMRRLFWGYPGATSPQAYAIPVSLAFFVQSQEPINSAYNYGLKLVLASCLLEEGGNVNIKPDGYLTQSCKFQAFESSTGAADDLKAILTNSSSASSF